MQKLKKKVAEGITARLNFDYACNRGHFFGEYHVHNAANEIILSNLDPKIHLVQNGYPAPQLRKKGSPGRPPEVDFAVIHRTEKQIHAVAEVKWAGSSHCTAKNVFIDLLRLQIIKDQLKECECFFILSGLRSDIDKLFKNRIFKEGSNCMLIRPQDNLISPKSKGRAKIFAIRGNADHPEQIGEYLLEFNRRNPDLQGDFFPHSIRTKYSYANLSAPPKTVVFKLMFGR